MKPSKEEMRARAEAADDKLRLIARRSDAVRACAFERMAAQLPVERLDLYGTPPTTFHAVVYFKTASEVGEFDEPASRSAIKGDIEAALAQLDPNAGLPEIRLDLDSIERMEAAQEGYFDRFR